MQEKIPLVVIAGPTASGKTGAGVALAKRLGGEVISADSMQIYKELTIGTAKPTPDEMEGIPHHLIDFADPREEFSVADYVPMAQKKIQEVWQRGKLPIIVGGTGLYISSLVDNVHFGESQSDPVLREELKAFAEEQGPQALWERLAQADPKAAEKIHPNNIGRVVRALEVYHTTGMTITRQQELSKLEPSPYRLCMMALSFHDRQKLYDRINQRVSIMLEEGLEEEARRFFQEGCGQTSFQAIGYKEMAAYFSGEETLEEACEHIRQESRRYAKRQLTWFKRDQRYHWFMAEDYPDRTQMYESMTELVRQELEI